MSYYVFTYEADSSDPKKRVWEVGQPFEAADHEAVASRDTAQREELLTAHKEGRTPKHIQLWTATGH